MKWTFRSYRSASSAVVLSVLILAGCQRGSSSGPTTSSVPVHDESSLTKVVISAEQVKSLDIKTEKARTEMVQERRRLNGWLQAPQGHEVTITAPVAGYIRAPKGGQVPLVGYPVTLNQELLAIDPVLTPLELVQLAALKRTIDSDLKKADENIRVAEAELKRTSDLHGQKLRSDQDLDLAKAKVEIAAEDKKAALDKQKLFDLTGGNKSAQLPQQPVFAPLGALVLSVQVSPGQFVPSAAPLMTLGDYTQLWVRVPVPEFDLPRVHKTEPAIVLLPGIAPAGLQAQGDVKAADARHLKAARKALVPQVDLVRHTAEVIYELPAGELAGLLAKDQMVTVLIPLGANAKESITKYSAVVFDAYGGAWVYLDRGTDAKGLRTYERRRVELGVGLGDDVSVRPAFQASDEVVIDGAGKLFSAEFFKPAVLKVK